MELKKKVQKQGRDERTQEDYPTPAKIQRRCRVVFLHSFISALFLYFFFSSIPFLLEMKFYRNFLSLSFCSFLWGFLNQLPKGRRTRFCARDEHCSAGDERVVNARSKFSHTHN